MRKGLGCGSGSAMILFGGIRIRIQVGKKTKVKKYTVLKCWMFFGGLEASPVAWASFVEA